LFITDFSSSVDKQKALDGSPCLVGQYAMILQEYDEALKPSGVTFTTVMMWVRSILYLPLGWMNTKRGARAAGLIGELLKIGTDEDGKVRGPYLRASQDFV
jgi:hypothetical protein